MLRERLIEQLFELSPSLKTKGYWTTKDGEQIPIDQITDSHLQNIVKLCKKRMEDRIHAYRQAKSDEKDPYCGIFSMGEDACDDSPFTCHEYDCYDFFD